MIRLSEAMARLYCKDEVQPKHVKEAFRLLNKSIIRVETPDIDFEEDQLQPVENGEDDDSEHWEENVGWVCGDVCLGRMFVWRRMCLGESGEFCLGDHVQQVS